MKRKKELKKFLMTRVDEDLHDRVKIQAFCMKMKIQDFVKLALEQFLEKLGEDK